MDSPANTTVMGMFRDRATAQRVKTSLIESGLADANISFHPEATTDASATHKASADQGFWSTMKDMFTGEDGSDDSLYYREGTEQGQVMVIARTTREQAPAVGELLERYGGTDVDLEQATATTTRATTSAQATAASAAQPVRANAAAAGTAVGGEKLQVVEEQMKVGKRKVAAGGVRIVSRVVERPVEEQVTLHRETVTVARQAVGRELTATEAEAALAAGERVIETRESDEEAVVSKTARVVEEVVVGKTSDDRVETVTGTVRSTKLDVENFGVDKTVDTTRTDPARRP